MAPKEAIIVFKLTATGVTLVKATEMTADGTDGSLAPIKMVIRRLNSGTLQSSSVNLYCTAAWILFVYLGDIRICKDVQEGGFAQHPSRRSAV